MSIGKVIKICIPLVLVLLLLVSACAEKPVTPKTGTIKVEHATDLTGPYSSPSIPMTEAERAYIKYLNDNGGIDGYQIVSIIDDTKSDPGLIATAYQAAVAQGIVARFVGIGAAYTAVASMQARDKIPSMGTGGEITIFKADVQDPASAWQYSSVGEPGKVFAGALDKYFYPEFQKKGLNRPMRIALMGWDILSARDNLKGTKAWAQQYPNKYQIVYESYTPYTVTDYTTVLTQLKAANPDFVAVTIYGTEGLLVKQAATVGLSPDIPFMWHGGLVASSVQMAGTEISRAVSWNMGALPGENYPINPIYNVLTSKYGLQFSGSSTMNGIQNVRLFEYVVKKALDKVGYANLNGAAVKEQLDKVCGVDLGFGNPLNFCEYNGDREGMTQIRMAKWDTAKNDQVLISDWFKVPTIVQEFGSNFQYLPS